MRYYCPDCEMEYTDIDDLTKCKICRSLNLERAVWIKADAQLCEENFRLIRERRMEDQDLIGTEHGYHCERCGETLDYGEEKRLADGTILCKPCDKKTGGKN